MMSWRDGAAAQYNHVLSIMKDTMDKTLFVIDRWEDAQFYIPVSVKMSYVEEPAAQGRGQEHPGSKIRRVTSP